MEVEADVYSGRPNPRWNLTPQQAEDLLKLVRALLDTGSADAPDSGLGYRGLVIRSGEPGKAGYDELVIGSGMVVARGQGRSRQFTDAGRAVERWVLETGKGFLENELYEYLSSEVGRN